MNCRIHDSGLLGSYYSGIFIAQPAKDQGGGHEIGHNTFYNFGRGAIHISSLGIWGDPGKYAKPIRIHHNDISNTMLICDDGGAIYQFCTDGNGSEISNNWIFNPGVQTIYFDNHSVGWHVHHNVLEGDVNVNNPHKNIHVFNNTILKTSYAVPKYFYSADNFVSNNIDACYGQYVASNGVRPTHVRFAAKGVRGLRYRVDEISQRENSNVKPRKSTVSGDDLPGYASNYLGAYEYGQGTPSDSASWTAGCNWGGAIPRVPRAASSPLPVKASEFAKGEGFRNNALYCSTTDSNAWACYQNVDFSSGFSHVVFNVRMETESPESAIELRLDSLDGETIANVKMNYHAENHQFHFQVAKLKEVTGIHDVYLGVRTETELQLSQFTFVGARDTPLYKVNPRKLINNGDKIETTDYVEGSRVMLIRDHDFKHSEMYMTGDHALKGCSAGRWVFFPRVDFASGCDHLLVNVGASKYDDPESRLELRSGMPDGRILGVLDVSEIEEGKWQEERMELSDASGIHDLFLVFPKTFDGGLNYIIF